jgi:hypothetical protein
MSVGVGSRDWERLFFFLWMSLRLSDSQFLETFLVLYEWD